MKFRRNKSGVQGLGRRFWRRDKKLEEPTHEAHLETPHDQPWVPRGLADRVRRSPRN